MADTTTKQGMKTKYKVMIAVLAVLVVACGALSVYFYQKSLALPEPASVSSVEEELERDPNMRKGQLLSLIHIATGQTSILVTG